MLCRYSIIWVVRPAEEPCAELCLITCLVVLSFSLMDFFFFFFSVSLLCLTPLKSELRKKSGVVVACHHLVCTMLFKIVYIQTALLEEA